MIQRICYAVALVAILVGLGTTLLPVGDGCGIAWQAAFTDCEQELARRRLLVAAVASTTVAVSSMGVAYIFRRGGGDDL